MLRFSHPYRIYRPLLIQTVDTGFGPLAIAVVFGTPRFIALTMLAGIGLVFWPLIVAAGIVLSFRENVGDLIARSKRSILRFSASSSSSSSWKKPKAKVPLLSAIAAVRCPLSHRSK